MKAIPSSISVVGGTLAAVCVCLSAGCGEAELDNYKAYNEVQQSEVASDPVASDTSETAEETLAGNAAGNEVEVPEESTVASEPSGEAVSDQRADEDPVAEETADVAAGDDEADGIDASSQQESPDSPTLAADAGPDSPIDSSQAAKPSIDRPSGEFNVPNVDAGEPDPVQPERASKSQKHREVKVLVKHREFDKEGPQGALRVSYDDIDLLKVLNMDPVTVNAPKLMPSWLRNLDGKRIRVRGFMYPSFEETGLRRFVLARDNQICCFGRNPKIYDLIEVQLRDGVTTDYIQGRPFDVVGVFHIDAAAYEDGELYQLYQIDDAIVIDK